MASTNNLLPGAKKSIPYVVDTGKFRYGNTDHVDFNAGSTVVFLWKMVELNKVRKSLSSSPLILD